VRRHPELWSLSFRAMILMPLSASTAELEAEHQQFAMDPGSSPPRVFLAHPSDKVTQALIDPCSSCLPSRSPAPKRLEARALPPKDGVRLNNAGRTEQARPELGHPNQQRPVTAAQSGTRRRMPQGDAELMTEKQVLGFKRADVEMRLELGHCRRVDHSSRPQRINANSSAIFTCDSKHNHAHPELGHSISDVRREPALLH
jgi:hypothetical protein